MGIQTTTIPATNASTGAAMTLTGQGGDSANGLGGYTVPGVDGAYANVNRASYHTTFPDKSGTPVRSRCRIVTPGALITATGTQGKSGFIQVDFTFPQEFTPAQRGVAYGMLIALLNDAKIKAQFLNDDIAS